VSRGRRTGASTALSHVETLDALIDERTDITALLDRTAVLRETARNVRADTDLDLGFASSVESEDISVIRGWAGDTAGGLRNIEVPMGMGLGGKAFALGRPVWVPDYCGSSLITHEYDTVVRAEGIGAMIAVPMLLRGSVLGVAYGAFRGAAQIGDELVKQLERVAAPAAKVLHLAQRASVQTTTAVTAERQRIAIALHDSVGALLFGIGAEVRDLQADADAPPQLIAKLRGVEARVAETAAAFRESLAVLDDVTPDQSLTATLRNDCEAFAQRTGLLARCVTLTDLPQLDAAHCACIVAVVREALVNVEKHAHAASVVVSLVASGDGVTVAVADDGLGWADAPVAGADPLPRLRAARRRSRGDSSSGIGLCASYDRIARLGGVLSVVGNEDGGLTVRMWVPV
jgi:signal transduction histidine kinase